MTSRLTNALIGISVTAAFLTGWTAFAAGTEWGQIVVIGHGVAGLALVALSIPKLPIARRGWARQRPGRPIELSLTVLAFTAVVSGVIQAGGWLPRLGPLNMMQIHVGSGVGVTLLTLWHLRRRPAPRPFDPARRAALQSLGVGFGAVALWGVTEAAIRVSGTDRRFTGSHERSSLEPAGLPQTSWINDSAPREPIELSISGRLVDLEQLDRAGTTLRATLDCTTGWFSVQDWHVVPLADLIGPGRTIEVRSATGYRRRFPGRDAPHLYLATRLGGRPLTPGHGAPVRLVAPGRRGFWWVKWVTEVTTDQRPWWLQFPFPLT